MHNGPRAVAFALLACAELSFQGSIGTAAAGERSAVAAPELTFAATGVPFGMTRFRGRIVYVNLFASWCEPCNREAPAVAALARTYARRGLVVIGIDEGEDASHALGFQKRYGLPYRIVLDPSSAVQRAMKQAALPMHVFFDRRGTIAATQIGSLDAKTAESTIDGLLRTRDR